MLRSIGYDIRESFKQIIRNRVMSLVSVLSISLMLLILGLFFFLTVNVNYITENLKTQFDTIEVFLLDDTSSQEAVAIANSLAEMTEVARVEYISKEKAMEEFKLRWGENAYMLDGLATNPLPNSLRLTLYDLEDGDLVAEISRTMVGVEDVRYYQTEVNKVMAISNALRKGALVIILFLIVVSVVVVSNTIKLTVMARQDEIAIMKYVGATNGFVRGPLLVEGLTIGILSSVVALGISAIAYIKIYQAISNQALMLLSSSLVNAGFMIYNLAWIFVALGASIGAVGSIISMRRFLKV